MEDNNLNNQDQPEKNKSFIDSLKLYFKIELRMAPAKMIINIILAVLYFAGLVVTAIIFRLLFLVLIIFGMLYLFFYNVISIPLQRKKQTLKRGYLFDHKSELKEYDAKVVLIRSVFTLIPSNHNGPFGGIIYCEVNGKYIKRNINLYYKVNSSIKIYMHDNALNYFLTEEELYPEKMLSKDKVLENEYKALKEKYDVNADFESSVSNPSDREYAKVYYKATFKASPVKAIIGWIFTVLYALTLIFILLFHTFFFPVIFIGSIIVLVIISGISRVIYNKIQEKKDKFMIENIDQLKVYSATIKFIMVNVSVQTRRIKKSFGYTIFCEVNGKYLRKNTEFQYLRDIPIKIYVHEKMPKYFLTEEEYLHAKMQLENK